MMCPSCGLEANRIPAGSHVSLTRTARSALPAVVLDPAGPCRESGKTGSDWRESELLAAGWKCRPQGVARIKAAETVAGPGIVDRLRIEFDHNSQTLDAKVERIAGVVHGRASLNVTEKRLLFAIAHRLENVFEAKHLLAGGAWKDISTVLRADKLFEHAVALYAPDGS